MKKLFLGLAYSLCVCANPSTAYQELKELLPFDGHSFYINASQMQNLLQEIQPKVVIELGSWLGSSTRHIAQLLPEDGIVYAVDHWLGSIEHHTPSFSHYLPTLYEQFLSNVIHSGLEHKIFPVRMSTLEAVELFRNEGIQPDLIYVDASHDEDSVYKDLQAYFPLIKGRGILCGDDWAWGTVRSAIERFAKENALRIEASHYFWVLRE